MKNVILHDELVASLLEELVPEDESVGLITCAECGDCCVSDYLCSICGVSLCSEECSDEHVPRCVADASGGA